MCTLRIHSTSTLLVRFTPSPIATFTLPDIWIVIVFLCRTHAPPSQSVILNVSLTSVTMLWSVTDTLARVKRGAGAGTTTPSPQPVATAHRRDVSEGEAVGMLMIAFKVRGGVLILLILRGLVFGTAYGRQLD